MSLPQFLISSLLWFQKSIHRSSLLTFTLSVCVLWYIKLWLAFWEIISSLSSHYSLPKNSSTNPRFSSMMHHSNESYMYSTAKYEQGGILKRNYFLWITGRLLGNNLYVLISIVVISGENAQRIRNTRSTKTT